LQSHYQLMDSILGCQAKLTVSTHLLVMSQRPSFWVYFSSFQSNS